MSGRLSKREGEWKSDEAKELGRVGKSWQANDRECDEGLLVNMWRLRTLQRLK